MARRKKVEPPRSVDEALRRSTRHARNALSEAMLAAHALLDAGSIAVTGRAASAPPLDDSTTGVALAALASRIEGLAAAFGAGRADVPEAWTRAILGALDAEIARWEQRSQDDGEARAVLRAFLGLREILWEFGVRGDESPSQDDRESRAAQRARAQRPRGQAAGKREERRDDAASGAPRGRQRARVQRVRVDG